MTTGARAFPPTTTTAETVRLYISPLAPELLSTILPKHLQAVASDVSYHTLQTFPEKPFGYITLDTVEAHKLKAKFNGSILRGAKMRVEESRPDKRRKRKAGDVGDAESVGKDETDKLARRHERKLRKRAERENGTLQAIELPEGRSVKRGWSSGSGLTKNGKSKEKKRNKDESDKGEMLFRTTLPPNAASQAHDSAKSSKKIKKDKLDSKGRKSVEMTEFSNTTKYPSFLRDTQVSKDDKRAVEFVEGQGWVDEDGNVVEAVERDSKRRRTESRHPGSVAKEPSKKEEQTEILSEPVDKKRESSQAQKTASPDEDASSNSAPPVFAQPKPVHPLEALFKRPALKAGEKGAKAGRPAPITTSFSFFSEPEEEDDGGDNADAANMAPPQTPFTRRDTEMRGIRSAAPTPDTAAIGKRFRMPWRQSTTDSSEHTGENDDIAEGGDANDDNDNEDDDDDGNDDPAEEPTADSPALATVDPETAADDGAHGQNDFEKHFWQQRGAYNRAWKARQREARKEVRQRENRRRGAAR